MKENTFLTNSQNEIKTKLDKIVDKQLKEVENERIKLTHKYSIDYLIERVRILSHQGEQLRGERDAINFEFNSYFNILNNNQKKLYLEVYNILKNY